MLRRWVMTIALIAVAVETTLLSFAVTDLHTKEHRAGCERVLILRVERDVVGYLAGDPTHSTQVLLTDAALLDVGCS